MTNTVAAIMALPGPLESIRLVGNEDKHATLLYFGEIGTLPNDAKQILTDSVEMAASMLSSFSERVRDISRLGSDNPPALVANLSDRNLSQIRNLFAMNPSVKSYLDNTEQFPSFTPHVTLAYPDFAEEALLRILMRQVYSVGFDRLAVWWNDERIEFPLNVNNDDSMAMSDEIGVFLEHHGVKGQKWGVVRKDQVGVSGIRSGDIPASRRKTETGILTTSSDIPSKKDIKTLSGSAILARNGALSNAAYGHIEALNTNIGKDLLANKYEWTDATQNKYNDTVANTMTEHANAALKNSNLTARVDVVADQSFLVVVGHPDAVASFPKKGLAHVSSFGVATLSIVPVRNEQGLILSLKASKEDMIMHSDYTPVEDILEHHGIRGMKWGVRRPVSTSTGLVARTSSEDQIHQDRIASKIAKSGPGSVSNADIRAYTQRLQLHDDLNRALAKQSAATQAKADGFLKKFVKSQGGRQIDRVVNKTLDIAVEKALESVGLKVGKKGFHPDVADTLVKVSGRLKPKKGKR